MECPICKTEMDDYTSYEDEYGRLQEERASCEKHRPSYAFEFAYGHAKESIGTVEIISAYFDNKQIREKKNQIAKLAIELAKLEMEENK